MRCVIKLFGIIFMISILSLVTIHTASAAPVIYSFSGTASGDLNGGDFTSQNFVINLYGDTDDITTDINGISVLTTADSALVRLDPNQNEGTMDLNVLADGFYDYEKKDAVMIIKTR